MSKPVRIDFLITGTGTGGAEKILFELVSGLPPEKYLSRVISMKKPGATAKKISSAGVKVVSLGLPEKTDFRYVIFLLFAVAKLLFLLLTDRPKILHCWLFQANIMGRFLARLCGVPVNISSLRVVEEERMVQYPIDLLSSRMVTKYTAVCKAVGDHYKKRLALSKDMIRVVPNGIDLESFTREPSSFDSQLKDKKYLVVGAMGRLHYQKGFDVLISALPDVINEQDNVRVLIAGDGPRKNELEILIEKLDVGTNVELVGEVSGPVEFLRKLDIFVLSSRWEGMPNVVLEAMAQGLPVIGTKAGGTPELVVCGGSETGILIEPENIKELSGALLSLLGDPERRETMSKSSLERVKKYDMDEMIQAYENLYSELLGD
jgi:glycosyltransferase involved in cell wall biosynthesis